MIETQAGVVIDRPVNEVFDFIVRFENVPLYVDAVAEAYQTSEGPVSAGTTGEEVLGPPFEGTRIAWTITRFQQDRLCAFRSTLRLPLWSELDQEVLYEFVLDEAGTRIIATHVGHLRGPLRLIGRLLADFGRRARQSMLVRIKKLLEGRPDLAPTRNPSEQP